jgi:hypothetical protein
MIRVAFVIGDYPPEQRRLRAGTTFASSASTGSDRGIPALKKILSSPTNRAMLEAILQRSSGTVPKGAHHQSRAPCVCT